MARAAALGHRRGIDRAGPLARIARIA